VHDFGAQVRDRLPLREADTARGREIREELTAHLEDVYADALRRGCSETEAIDLAQAQVIDWTQLAQRLAHAEDGDTMISHHTRTIWRPGMAMLCCVAALHIGLSWFAPGEWWADTRLRATMIVAMLAFYVAFGATAAAWSRRAGGTVRERLAAGLLPVALHIAVVLPALVLGSLAERARHPEWRINPQPKVMLALIVVPGLALTAGAAPFLRRRPRTDEDRLDTSAL
jgi:MFS family permease